MNREGVWSEMRCFTWDRSILDGDRPIETSSCPSFFFFLCYFLYLFIFFILFFFVSLLVPRSLPPLSCQLCPDRTPADRFVCRNGWQTMCQRWQLAQPQPEYAMNSFLFGDAKGQHISTVSEGATAKEFLFLYMNRAVSRKRDRETFPGIQQFKNHPTRGEKIPRVSSMSI